MWVEIKEKKKIVNNKYIKIFLRLVSKEDRKCHWVQRIKENRDGFDEILYYFGVFWLMTFIFIFFESMLQITVLEKGNPVLIKKKNKTLPKAVSFLGWKTWEPVEKERNTNRLDPFLRIQAGCRDEKIMNVSWFL